MSERKEEIAEFARNHPVGFLKRPPDFNRLPFLSAAKGFMVPKRIDLRDYCTQTEDQLNRPWCAAFAAAGFAENVLWRKNDHFDQIDPAWIYRYAKMNDGDPNGDGTTLTAALDALTDGNSPLFDRRKCQVRVLRSNGLALRYAIHKYGCCLGGFNITREWYSIGKDSPYIVGNGSQAGIGGHAVLICGYDREGVWLQNSWGWRWGEYGFARISWPCWSSQWIYGAVIDNCLTDFKLTET